jgi:hypothetical protein
MTRRVLILTFVLAAAAAPCLAGPMPEQRPFGGYPDTMPPAEGPYALTGETGETRTGWELHTVRIGTRVEREIFFPTFD